MDSARSSPGFLSFLKFGSSPQQNLPPLKPTYAEQAIQAIWNAAGQIGEGLDSLGDTILSIPENLFSASTSLVGRVSNATTDALTYSVKQIGEGLLILSDRHAHPILSSALPAAMGGAALFYGYNHLKEGYDEGNWVKIKKKEGNKPQPSVEMLKFVKRDDGLNLEFVSPNPSNEYRIGIPLSKNDLVFQKDKISKTASCFLQGGTLVTLGVSAELGSLARVLNENLPGLSGVFAHSVAALPNQIVSSIGHILSRTESPVIGAGLAGTLSIAGIYTWSTIKLSGAKDGWFDWEKEGWERVDFKAVANDVSKFVLGWALITAAGYKITHL